MTGAMSASRNCAIAAASERLFWLLSIKMSSLNGFSIIMGEMGEKGHTHGVWPRESGSRVEDLLAVRRRILVGLEEGLGKTADKGGGEI